MLNGTIGGRYALAGAIASGGMATVHLARQVGAAGFARIVAIKRLHERYARDPEFVAMFLDEARIVARIRHPNVVQTVDVVAEDGELFLVMEYVHGESLLKLMQMSNRAGTTLPIPVLAAVIAGALHGLHEAHEARSETGEPLGIVHRDVSPHNILVGVDGTSRVLDFGVAKASERIQTTHEGQLKGKLSYMAPEQVTNLPLDRRTDVYAAAVVMWEALTGTKLFHGGSEGAVLNQILVDPQRPPSRLNRAVPGPLEAIVMRGLSRDPGERFATAHEMAVAIEHAVTVATPTEVGALVASTCQPSISARAEVIATIEARASSTNMREAVDSLRTLAASRSVPSAGPMRTSPPPPDVRPGSGSVALPVPVPMPLPPPPRPPFGATSIAPPEAQPRGDARVVGAVVASIVIVTAVLATGGWLLLAKRRMMDEAVATATSTSASAGDASGAIGDASGLASAQPAVAAPSACPEGMAFVPGGRFFMGSDDDLPAERPSHKVTLRGYCMDRLEVTAAAYRACSDRGDCKRASTTNRWDGISARESRSYDPLCNAAFDAPARGHHPINCVDWNQAERFCKAEGKRLPTEAEWEFAARGSDGRKYPWGDAAPSVKHLNACGAECVAWGKKHGAALEALFAESDAWATTAPVGSFPLGVSRWGIEDLVGNVWEWVADAFGPYGEADQDDPQGPPGGETRVMRGGAWNGAYSDWVRPSFRFHGAPDTRSHGVGFRCAKTP